MSHHPEDHALSRGPRYRSVWITFVRNALIREMTFRSNFIITVMTRALWFCSQVLLFKIIFHNVQHITPGWNEYQYFAFMATGMLINALVESLFMPNMANFSELIRTGNLDFALLKPIDTQFLVSFEKMDLAMLNQILLATGLLTYALSNLPDDSSVQVTAAGILLYLLFVAAGVVILYSLMISLASTAIWFGRNQGLYDFWFYITVFARYPRSIYQTATPGGDVIRFVFTFIVPILVVVTVPARVLLDTLGQQAWLAGISIATAVIGIFLSRLVFTWSLRSYRSASS